MLPEAKHRFRRDDIELAPMSGRPRPARHVHDVEEAVRADDRDSMHDTLQPTAYTAALSVSYDETKSYRRASSK